MSKAMGWHQLLDHLQDAALLFGADGAVIRWNDAAVRLLGLAAKAEGGDSEPTGIELFDQHGNPLRGRSNPLTASLADGAPRVLQGFVRHASGHLVPVVVRVASLPAEGGCAGATFVLLHDDSETTVLRRQIDDLRDQALIDHATGAASRTYAELQLITRLAELDRYGWAFGAALVAVDHWDDLARQHGEVHRRDLLKMVADSLLNATRSSDLVGSWDDGTFVVLLPNVAPDTLRTSAERYRRVIEQGQHQAYGEQVRVTASVGATLAHKNDAVGALVQRLHDQVEASRRAGGNRVTATT